MKKYIDIANKKLEEIRHKEDIIILAIESSCDETACAVMRGRQLLSNVIASQIEIHKRFGGVVPEIASRNHTLAINNVVKQAITDANITFKEIDAIGVTYGAGLLGALIVGVAYAKALAFSLQIPLIAVNHIKGHISANYIGEPNLKPPYLCLIASGGHTAIVKILSYIDLEIIGSTQDDACGEAFDKVARVLGLPYPGGVQIEKLAKLGRNNIELPTPYKGEEHFNFSFSGLKTAVINYIHNAQQKGETVNNADVACSFQEKVTSILVTNTVRAAEKYNIKTIVIAGGVGSNTKLREKFVAEAAVKGIKLIYPPLILCTDNAAMIASETLNLIKNGVTSSDMDLDANANVKIID